MLYLHGHVGAKSCKSGRCAHFLFFRALYEVVLTVIQKDRLSQIWSIADRVAHDYRLEIFDVQLQREAIGWVVRVIIDRPPRNIGAESDKCDETVNINDCQRLSREVSAVLDVEFSFDQAYTLEVSSPGLDRQLRHLVDCRRFEGRLAKFVTSDPVDGQQHLSGRIIGVEDACSDGMEGDGRGVVVLETLRHKKHRIPWPLVTRARLEVEF